MSEIFTEKQLDLPRTDVALDLKWWTHKLFEQLAYSEFGEFDELEAIKRIEARYGVQEPTDDPSYWALQDRLMVVARYDEHDFLPEGEIERVFEDVTRYDDQLQGEA